MSMREILMFDDLPFEMRAKCSTVIQCLIMVRSAVVSIPPGVPNELLLVPVIEERNWCNALCGMCYPVCKMCI